jgi:hypothetical protein
MLRRKKMKRLILIVGILFAFSLSAYAQMGVMGGQQSQMGQGMMMGEGQQMPMMKQMMGQGMMMQDMMQMMMDIMKMQQKIMKGMKSAEKKEMMREMDKMIEKMEKMMSMRQGMMGQPSDICQCRLTCAEQLKKAIDLHEIHIKDPKTATEASQMEMMDQMKKAYDCIAGTCCGVCRTPLKEPESKETEKKKAPEKDEHGH